MDRAHPTDHSILSTAPQAAQKADIHQSCLPKSPPCTVFLGNLPYDVTENSVKEFFRGWNTSEVHSLQEPSNPDRVNRLGYAEFEDLGDLLSALCL
ncbi:Eukaryotic translation initiation factor 4B [Lemmus lemmus]